MPNLCHRSQKQFDILASGASCPTLMFEFAFSTMRINRKDIFNSDSFVDFVLLMARQKVQHSITNSFKDHESSITIIGRLS